MTNEEALKILQRQQVCDAKRHSDRVNCFANNCLECEDLVLDEDLREAQGIAMKALKIQDADGCQGCKYETKDEFEPPCVHCKRSKMDFWRGVMLVD